MASSIHKLKVCDRILGECLGFEDTFDAIQNAVRDFLGDNFISIYLALIDPEAPDFFFLLDSDHFTFNYFRDKHILSDDLTSYALKFPKEMQIINNPEVFCLKHQIRPVDYTDSVAIAPLISEKKIKGAIFCRFVKPDENSEKSLRPFLRAIADTLSLVVEKLHHYEIVRQELVEMRAISEIGTRMYGARKPDNVLQEIIDNVIVKLGFDRVLICLIDEKTNKLVGRITHGYEETIHLVNHSIATSSDILVEVARTGKAQIVQDVRADFRFPKFIRQRSDIWQCAIVPLISSDGRIWGTLSADHRVNRGQITRRRLTILEEFARHASIAIENARLYEDVEHMAEVDGLTRVYNRQYFDRALKMEIPRVKRYDLPLSLLMIDIRDFKNFNDRFGHEVGDQVLREVARLIVDNTRETDIVARYGGDEFVVLMPNTTQEQAKMLQDRIEQSVLLRNSRKTEQWEQFQLSIGLKSASAINVDNILSEADQAMYRGRAKLIKQSLLHALITNDTHEVERWDHFVADILKILTDREPHFNSHSRRVMNYAVKISQLLGLGHNFLEIVSIASLLHDIGKISISPDLLNKSGPLSVEEYAVVKKHPALGRDLLKGADYLKNVCEIIYHHHERWDGKTDGPFPAYPMGIKGEQIPLGARIIKVADAYDAMTSWRPYSKPKRTDEAIRELLELKGQSFDPQVVKVFVPYLRTITSSLAGSYPFVASQNNF